MKSCKGRCMAGERLSGANDLCGGAFRLKYKTGYDPATRASRPLLYAIQGGHLVYTSVGHSYKRYGHSVEKPHIRPDFLRKRSIHSDVSLFTSIDYAGVHHRTNNLFPPHLSPTPPAQLHRSGRGSFFIRWMQRAQKEYFCSAFMISCLIHQVALESNPIS